MDQLLSRLEKDKDRRKTKTRTEKKDENKEKNCQSSFGLAVPDVGPVAVVDRRLFLVVGVDNANKII